jgi:natural product biosynthesis luciferase-like monooxygenase protein
MLPLSHIRCWLIGADSLLEACGELLLRDGHAILGVVAPNGRIAEWARSRSLATVDPASDYGAVLAAQPFDYLFAITHLALVPERVLRQPQQCAINFHDGPLPDYAGLNAPVWALINREARYGVTWHAMTATIDAGDILKQKHFDVAPDETAFSLHAKCFEAGLESFGELVRDLATRTLRPVPQDGARRRYFERHRRPLAAGAIDWTRPALEIEALVRALDFGRYSNPVGLAKARRKDEVVAITYAKASDGVRANGSAPGTLLAIDDDSALIATGDGAIALRGFADLRGVAMAPREAARRLRLGVGAALNNLSPEHAQRLTELDRRMSRGERAWVRRLSELDPITLPCPVAAPGATARARAAAIEVRTPTRMHEDIADHSASTVLTAAFCAYIGRLARRRSFDIGYRDVALGDETAGLEAWIAARVLLHVELRDGESLASFVARVADDLAGVRRRGPWLRDLFARHPQLHRLREDRPGHMLPVAVEQRAAFGAPALPDGAEWTLEIAGESGACRCVYDAERISAEHAQSLCRGFEAFLGSAIAQPSLALDAYELVDAQERDQQLQWNGTAQPDDHAACIQHLFAEQARRTPDATAVVCDGRSLTYAKLATRASQLAAELRELGVRAGTLVGICVERSLDLAVAVLGVLEAGGAYVPLDPALPAARLAFMVDDAQLAVIVTQERLERSLPANEARVLRIDADWPRIAARAPRTAADDASPTDLAYAIYTSGSTGQPKGVLVEHAQVASFFAAIDERIPHDPPGVWLAVTSLSFDISVLELLWTLTRGFEVVVHSGREGVASHKRAPAPSARRPIEFSLFYFASDEGDQGKDAYRLLLEGARFADANGFRAVWTPERHFHAFGGPYPNPAVTGAALAATTRHVEIRAGSVVLPLHHPIRVAEDWAVVDNLSGGRVAISFASGWHPDDFVLAPQNHAHAKDVMLRDIDVVRRLWRGETVAFPGPNGAAVEVRTLPRPVQPELPVWITCAGNIATYEAAGRIGANVLTHLLGQSIEQIAPKIAAYRDARAAAGFDPATGIVSLMLHTFVGDDEASVRERVKGPLERYLGSSLSLLGNHAAAFPTFRRPSGAPTNGHDISEMSQADRDALLAHARERYYETSGLFGTPQRCAEMVERLRAIGVDEIACLIDFGVPVDDVLASLPQLDRVRRQAQEPSAAPSEPSESSLADEIRREGVTHLQCTPSLARVLCSDDESRRALREVRHLFVGGEALPETLARELATLCGSVTNMYGPTETTIWSSTHGVGDGDASSASTVAIGRPLANTRFYVLDERSQLLPIGVAGELAIGGTSVARGYLRRPELEAQRFVADPWAAASGARMYRTGDLVRYRGDGVVEFLGRTDHQIKVRGHRIEPGEIESLLTREPSVAEAVVVAREDAPGDQRLVAYAVVRDPAPDPARLRERLAAQLPEYMVPAQLVFIDALPRTPNGKLDRRALPAPGLAARPFAICAPPSSELETRIAELWQETLGVESLGVEDNFFDLGGHSLLAVRIHRRLKDMAARGEVTSKPVSLTDLFRFPTVRSLARFLACEVAPGGLDEASLRGRRRRTSLLRRRQGASEA